MAHKAEFRKKAEILLEKLDDKMGIVEECVHQLYLLQQKTHVEGYNELLDETDRQVSDMYYVKNKFLEKLRELK